MNTLFDCRPYDVKPISVSIENLNPNDVMVKQVDMGQIKVLQPLLSKAVWRPAPGRKLGFKVLHRDSLLGIICLASPVINLSVRDDYLKLNKDPSKKGMELRTYADMSVCVATQPFGWHWNGGKLIALVATTLGDYWTLRYGDELKGIITTSLWGKSKQYNRVYKFLGYTKGFGHEHIDDERYAQMLKYLSDNGHKIPSSRFGAGSNPRMRRIQAYRKASGDKTVTLVHGNKRGVYYHQSQPPADRLQVIKAWHDRWGLPRYERTKDREPPYTTGLQNEMKQT